MDECNHGLRCRSFSLAIVVIIIYTGIVIIYVPPSIHNGMYNTFESVTSKKHSRIKTSFAQLYEDTKCIIEHSNVTCSFPLLTDYHRRCGYFPGLTSWTHISAGFPWASMSAQICRVPPVSSAPSQLRHYISQRQISSVVIFGDSQGGRYSTALLKTLSKSGFHCGLKKSEPFGLHTHLNYYTEGSLFVPNHTVARTCRSCARGLSLCADKAGHKLSVEYISMSRASSSPLGGHCNGSHHPLCQNTTQQEYVLKHYLRRRNTYPQLLLFFSTFPHDTMQPLTGTYDDMRYLYDLITRHVPASTTVIWYNAPAWHPLKFKWPWGTSEGRGYSPNDKMQAENHFLSKLQVLHHESGNTPAMYSFFDLYHMDEQLRGAWDADHIHYKPSWYAYVIGYTAAMLPSIP